MSLELWTLAAAAIFWVGMSKSGFGGGMGILATPLMVIALPAKTAIGVMLPLLILCDIVSCWFYRKDWLGPPLRCYLPASLIGVIAGTLYLNVVDVGTLRRMLGGICLLFCIWHSAKLFMATRRGTPAGELPGWRAASAYGFATGVVSSLAHAAGPVFAMYLLPAGLSPRQFVATSVYAFTFVNLIKVPGYVAVGVMGAGTLHLSLLLAPALLAGTLFGFWLNKHLPGPWFQRTLIFFLALTGLYLLIWGG